MSKRTGKRKFGKISFEVVVWYSLKRDAQKTANAIRRHSRFARITGNSKSGYTVWSSVLVGR